MLRSGDFFWGGVGSKSVSKQVLFELFEVFSNTVISVKNEIREICGNENLTAPNEHIIIFMGSP